MKNKINKNLCLLFSKETPHSTALKGSALTCCSHPCLLQKLLHISGNTANATWVSTLMSFFLFSSGYEGNQIPCCLVWVTTWKPISLRFTILKTILKFDMQALHPPACIKQTSNLIQELQLFFLNKNLKLHKNSTKTVHTKERCGHQHVTLGRNPHQR